MHIVLIVIAVLLLLALVFLPQLWMQRVMKQYQQPDDKYPGTGAQFAQHLLKRFGMDDITVKQANEGDHYNPISRSVGLSEPHYQGRSLAAIVVAAHEVGHAMQHRSRSKLFRLRTALAMVANAAEKAGIVIFMLMPVLTILSRNPLVGAVITSAAIGMLFMGVIVHLITLPVELDASFNRALPVLQAGQYIDEQDMPAARKLLKAAAMTYVAGALASLLNFTRWLAILRR
jgi:Zn-dependent membrane protease YugP